MGIERLLAASAAALTICASASAQDGDDGGLRRDGFYLGGGPSVSVYESPTSFGDRFDAFGFGALQVRGGYSFTTFLAVEAEASTGFVSYEATYTDDSSSTYETDDVDLASAFGGFLVGRIPIGRLVDINGRLGYTKSELEFDDPDVATLEYSGPAVGVGVGFNLDFIGISLDYTHAAADLEGFDGTYEAGAFNVTVTGRF